MGKSIISLSYHGDFSSLDMYFEKLKNLFNIGTLDKYGRMGVELLKEYTPKDTGLTSESWIYTINHTEDGAEIVWNNTNIQNGVNIAIILQYGHATGTGGYVEGIDYINPALAEVFKKIAADAQKEVNRI